MRAKALALGACGFSTLFFTSLTLANPVGGTVVGGPGNATISGEGTSLTTINQTGNRVIINWQDFSIGAGETTRFVQPNAGAWALNRVLSGNPTQIYGSLQANGHVFVINPNGILVGSGGVIDTKGFTASTYDIPNSKFFSGVGVTLSGDSTASIRNQGTINALGGDVFLIAHSVENDGAINAAQGTVGLAAGSSVRLMQSGAERISVLAGNSSSPTSVGVNNQGSIDAASAELKAAGGNIYALAINNQGVVRANTVVNEGGHIWLRAGGGNINNSGTLAANGANGNGGSVIVDGGHNASSPATVTSSGNISASGNGTAGKGGTVELLGDHVGLLDNATVDASGTVGGGAVLVGGDAHGANPSIHNSQGTFASPNAQISADALASGNGGKVVVWSDDATRFYGSISARGGAQSGNGGFIETSGKGFLDVNGAQINAGAPNGQHGDWLMDPHNVTIDNQTTTAPPGYSATYTASQDDSHVNVGQINGSLANGTDVTISTGTTGTQNGDINVNALITASPNNTATLTLNAAGAININNDGTTTFGGIQNQSANKDLNVVFTAGGAVMLGGPINLGGNGTLAITAGGDITQTAAGIITVNGGASTFTIANAANKNVLLASAANDFGGQSVSFVNGTGGTIQDVAIRNTSSSATFGHLTLPALRNLTVAFDNHSITVPAITLTGNLTLTGNGITDSGIVVVNGTTTLTAGSGNDITLNNNDTFGSTVSVVSGRNVTLNDAGGDIVLGASTVSGTLSVTAQGNITEVGALTVKSGASTFTVDTATGKNILLDTQANDFGSQTVTFRAINGGSVNNAGLENINASAVFPTLTTLLPLNNLDIILNNAPVTLPGLTLTGNLSVTAGGDITQTGALLMGGAGQTATFTAGANNITLTFGTSTPANDFGTVIINSANNVSLGDVNAVNLGASTIGGTLTVHSVGDITESGVLNVTGLTTLNAGPLGNVHLDTQLNDFSTVAIISANNVSLNDANPLTVGGTLVGTLTTTSGGATVLNTTTAGALNITSGGNITENGALTANTGASSFTINNATADIRLDTQANHFGAQTVTFNTLGTGAIRDLGFRNVDATAVLPTIPSGLRNVTLQFDAASVILPGLTLSGTLDLLVGNNIIFNNSITAGSVIAHSGMSGSGNTTFRLGVTIDADSQSYQAGDGPGGGTTSTVDLVGNNPTFLNTAGSAAPLSFTYWQDAAITALNIPAASQFGGAFPAALVFRSDDGGVQLPALTLPGTLRVTANGDITETGALTVPGGSTFTIETGTGSVLLSQANDFGSSGITINTISGGNVLDVNLHDINAAAAIPTLPANLRNLTLSFDNAAIALPGLTLSGTLSVLARNITETGPLNVTAGASTFTINGSLGDILLGNQANHFANQTVTFNTAGGGIIRDISLHNVDGNALFPVISSPSLRNVTVDFDAAAMQVPTLSLSGLLSLTAGQGITFNGTIGAGSLNAHSGTTGTGNIAFAPGIAIDADSQSYQAGSGSGNTAFIDLSGAPSFRNTAALAAPVNFVFRQDAPITTVPVAAFFGGAFPTALTLESDGGGVTLPAMTLPGTLDVIANGNITETGPLIANAGGSTFTIQTGAGSVLLGTQANDFGNQNVVINTTGGGTVQDVSFRNVNALAAFPTLPAALRNLTIIFDTAPILQNSLINVSQLASFTSGGVGAAGDITLNNAGNTFGSLALNSVQGTAVSVNSAGAVALDNIAVNAGSLNVTAGGALTQVAGKTINVGGLATFTSSGNNANGDITLNNNGNNFGSLGLNSANGTAVAVTDSGATLLDQVAVGGSLTISSAGAINQVGGQTINVGGLASFNSSGLAAAGNIILFNTGNNFGSLGINTANGVAVDVQTAGAVALDNVAVNNGSFVLEAGGAISQVAGKNINVSGLGGFISSGVGANGDITLNNAGNNFGSFGVISANGSAVSMREASDTALDTVTVNNGTLSITSAGGITQVAGRVITSGGVATFAAAPGSDIILANGGNDFSTVNIASGNNVSLLDVNSLAVGGTMGGNLTTVAGTTTTLDAMTVGGNLNVTAAGLINDAGAVNITGTTTLSAGAANDILLTQADTFGGGVNILSGHNVNVNDVGNLTIGGTVGGNLTTTAGGSTALNATTVGGNLSATAHGTISQNAALTVTGTTSLDAGAGNDITLANAANAFGAPVTVNGKNVTLDDAGALAVGGTVGGNLTTTSAGATVLDATTVGGNLNVTANGISDAGAVTVNGTTTLAAGAGNIALAQADSFVGAVNIVSANNVTLNDVSALTVGGTVSGSLATTSGGATTFNALSVGGNLNSTANGTINDSAPITVAGSTTLAAGGNDITLDAGDTLTGPVTVTSGKNVTIDDTVALTLGGTVSGNLATTSGGALTFNATTVGGTIDATANGPITETGPIVDTGAATFAAGANDIILNNAGNDFNSVAIASGNNVSLVDANNINLAASSISGALAITAGGNITESGNLSLNNNETLSAGGTIALAASTIGGNLSANAVSGITQNGALSVAGNSSFTSGGDVILSQAGNTFNGPVSFAGALQNVTIANSGSFNIQAVNVANTLDVRSGGAVTQSGDITAGQLQVSANGNVTLNGNNNVTTVAGKVTGTGNTFEFTDHSALTVGTVNGVAGITTQNGNVTLSSDTMTLNDVINTGGRTADVFLQAVTAGRPITFPKAAGAFGFDQGELNLISADTVQVGNSSAGPVSGGHNVSPISFNKLVIIGGGQNLQTLSEQVAGLSAVSGVVLAPKLRTVNLTGAAVTSEEAAKILEPGAIGTLWLQLPFPPSKEEHLVIEDIGKWTGGRIAAAGTTTGPQMGK